MRRPMVLGIVLTMAVTPVLWAQTHKVNVSTEGDYRIIESNGIPVHSPGMFPNKGNPNTVAAQEYRFRVPLNPPAPGAARIFDNRTLFGVTVEGVPFDPGTAEYWNDDPSSGWNYEALSGKIDLGIDSHNAHVQPNGAYHYHGIPDALSGSPDTILSPLVGYAADGFPIYVSHQLRSSFQLQKGQRTTGPGGVYDGTFVQDYQYVAGSGDLDECNGRTAPTEDYPQGTYHYVLTAQFPFVPRCHKGTPDASFSKGHEHRRHPMDGQGDPGGRALGAVGRHGRPGERKAEHRTPPPEATDVCQGQSEGDACAFRAPHGRLSGVCHRLPEGLVACIPDDMPRP